MTRDEYIEANWRRFVEPADAHPEPQRFAESRRVRARARAGMRWDESRQPRAIVCQWALRRMLSTFFGPFLLGRGSTDEMLLWAVALELDEQLPATQTGEMVCRVCSGWGEVIVDIDIGTFIDPAFMTRCRKRGTISIDGSSKIPGLRMAAPNLRESADRRVRIVVQRCVCEHKRKRPHTVQLHRIVEIIAAMRSPRVDDWPAQWLVDIDRREAAGDRSPLEVWWAQFYAWTRGGMVDEQALADALEELARSRRSTMRVTGGTALAELGLDIRVDGENPVEVTFGVDLASGPDSTVSAEVERGPDGSLRTRTLSFPPSSGTSADVLAHVYRRLADEGIRVTGLRLDEVGVGQVHLSYDRAYQWPTRGDDAVLAAARDAVPAGVYVTAGARLRGLEDHYP